MNTKNLIISLIILFAPITKSFASEQQALRNATCNQRHTNCIVSCKDSNCMANCYNSYLECINN